MPDMSVAVQASARGGSTLRGIRPRHGPSVSRIRQGTRPRPGAEVEWPPQQGAPMPKGVQSSNKMTKKPKKDTSPPKEITLGNKPVAPVTTIAPKGKAKYK